MPKSTRRRFLQAAAVGAALPLVVAPMVQAGEPASADQSLLAIVRERFKHLTEDQLKAVQRGLRNGLASGRQQAACGSTRSVSRRRFSWPMWRNRADITSG